MIMAQFVNWTSKSGRIKKIKVCDGWRFVKEQQEVYSSDLSFRNGKWVDVDDSIQTVTKDTIIIRKIAGSSSSELEPDKTEKQA
jgi:hypothetical protein